MYGRLEAVLNSTDTDRISRISQKGEYIIALTYILNRSWCSREWVLQEAALSSKPLTMRGSQTFDLRILDYFILIAGKFEKQETNSFRTSRVLKKKGAQMLHNIQNCRKRVL
ncbi:hypothetical protein K469DRAFT_698794 [Zopfia rhizophila CBS 207.26]|uniref:Heterokaryon incompatibility domain-containing protein n=1 Tax=Zopfia rhizophila CBS 207.26 TaxID=1314779 RepID=A0A6A6ESV2_9PEZI|nr:hypothetical protein K469DRAFT_698794 [Zopfia rhizophila CBS 207.26]